MTGASQGPLALVGAGPALRALAVLCGRSGREVVHFDPRAAVDDIARAAPGGTAVLCLPHGESREPGRGLLARGLRVVDLGSDQRLLAHATPALPELDVRGRRLVSVPSAGALAAWTCAAPLLEAGLLHPDRLSVLLLLGDELDAGDAAPQPAQPGARLAAEGARVAQELSWIFESRGWPAQRLTCVSVSAPIAAGMFAVVQGDVASAEAGEPASVAAALAALPPAPWRRVATQPATAPLAGLPVAEIAAAVDGFCERITCTCALDAAFFVAAAALRAA